MRRLLPRRPREVNKRGQILLLFGFIWVAIGVGIYQNPTLPGHEHLLFEQAPVALRAAGWVVTGLASMVYALRPRDFGHDGLGFLALYLMPAIAAAVFLWGWVEWVLPIGGPGYPSGLLSFAVYLAIVVAIMVVASWPDPPLNPPPSGEPR